MQLASRPGGCLYSIQPQRWQPIINFRKTIMTTVTTQQPAPAAPFSLMGIIETVFAIQLREQLNSENKGDQSDAAYTWGL